MEEIKEIVKKSYIARILWKKLKDSLHVINNYILKKKLLWKYKNSDDNEIKEITTFLRKNKLYLYNYNWYLDYIKANVTIYFDKHQKFIYFLHNGQRVYYKKAMDAGGGG